MKPNFRSSINSRFWIPIASIIATLLILEGSIRTYDLFRGYGFFSDHRNLVVRRTLAGSTTNSTDQTRFPFRTYGFPLYKQVNNVTHISSRHGELFPIPKPTNTYRIVVFGGSTTENSHVYDQTQMHYPLLLQSYLREELASDNIEVINLGMSGYATPHSLILLQLDVLSWDPDLVILSHNINDLLTSYWPNFTYDYSHQYGTQHYFYNISLPNLIFQHSQLYWLVKFRLNPAHEMIRKPYGDALPKESLNVFKRNLKTFIAISKKNNVQVLLGNQPLQRNEEYFDSHMRHKKYNNIVVYPLHDEFITHHTTFNKIIEQVDKENNVLFVDSDKILANNEELFIDFVHYTSVGVQVLAQGYADYILDHKIIN